MTYVVTWRCLGTKDRSCVEVCPVDCFYDIRKRSYNKKYGVPVEGEDGDRQVGQLMIAATQRPQGAGDGAELHQAQVQCGLGRSGIQSDLSFPAVACLMCALGGIQLKALVARDIWDMSQYFQVWNETNEIVQRAVKLLTTGK